MGACRRRTSRARSSRPAGRTRAATWKVLSQHVSEIARGGVDEVVQLVVGPGLTGGRPVADPHADGVEKHGLDIAVHLEPYEKWQRTRAIVEADFEYLRELGVGRVYVYYPFDGLIADTAWLELSAQFPSIELYAQTSDAARAAAAGFDGVYTYDVYAVRGGAFAGFCARATKAGIACAPFGRAGLQRESRDAGSPRAEPPRGRRRTTACGARRSRPSPIASRSRATTSGTKARRSSPPAGGRTTIYGSYASYEGAYGLTGTARRAGVPRPDGVLDEDVPRRRCGHRGARAGQSVPVRLAAGQAKTSAPQLVDERGLDVALSHAAQRRVVEIDVDRGPAVEADGESAARAADGEELVRAEHIA